MNGSHVYYFGLACIVFFPFCTTVSAKAQDPQIAVLVGHTGSAESITFCSNGKYLLSGDDTTLRLWDVSKKHVSKTFSGHSKWIKSVDCSLDQKTVASASADNIVKLWDIENVKLRHTLVQKDQVNSIAFSRDSKLLAIGTYGAILLLDVQTAEAKREISIYDYYGPEATLVKFSYDGLNLMSTIVDRYGNIPGSFREWDLGTGKLTRDVELGFGYWPENPRIGLSPDGTLAAYWRKLGKELLIWDIKKRKEKFRLPNYQDTIWSFVFSPDANILAIACYDHTLRLLNTHTGVEFGRITFGKKEGVYALAFSPDGKTLASGMGDGSIRLLDVGKIQGKVTGGNRKVGR